MRLTLLLAAVLIAGCDGAGVESTPTQPPTLEPTRSAPGQPTPAATGTPSPSQPASDFVPGSVSYRVVNLADEPVDVYVRSQGIVEAWLVHEGLATGEVADYVAPPDPGTLTITAAGTGDPTCVGSCPHFLASIGNTNAHSSHNTVVVHHAGVTEYWEQPDPAEVGQSSNALPPNDTSLAMVFAIGRGVENADFGLRIAFVGADGCAVDEEQSNLLVGGTSVLAYTFDGATQVTVHDPADTGCEEQPLGGPFPISGEAGSRTMLLLYGTVEQMEALALPIE